ncbi:hypothetical protein U2F26_30910 [Micromonospora sp. 4G57]|uniref:Uncharacterized protein n=1 Tax=Micromonospora sicca TaxID=2202420 RepID=A0ABU5JK93_9ACTN|nr:MULTISPECIES: hypothetical protein [unclassified Micromonospora]MDZ5447079.1 hypothetical protein [Micromonospora sp. 4G57]MDZ5493044.1 hypothetical protein [Micromonospora sp. 4G53]
MQVRAAEPTEQDFQDLKPGAEPLAVTSSLMRHGVRPVVRAPVPDPLAEAALEALPTS